jgi:hypothetical protein
MSPQQSSHQQEYDADGLGLRLQILSLPDRSQVVTALSSAVYFLEIMELLKVRLMLLAEFVNYQHWIIEKTHPPNLGRLMKLLGEAEALHVGGQEGLVKIHESLAGLNMDLIGFVTEQQDRVRDQTLRLIGDVAAGSQKPRKGQLLRPAAPGQAESPAVPEFLRLFDKSPVGVLRALEPLDGEGTDASGAAGQRQAEVIEQLASALPQKFQDFRRMTPEQRAARLA